MKKNWIVRWSAWTPLHLLVGFADLIEGVIGVVTLGFVRLPFRLMLAERIARYRMRRNSRKDGA